MYVKVPSEMDEDDGKKENNTLMKVNLYGFVSENELRPYCEMGYLYLEYLN